MSGRKLIPRVRVIKRIRSIRVRDREWDEWKEANPKGSGNKANKKY